MSENSLRYYSKMIAHRLKNYHKGFDFTMGIVSDSSRASAFVDLVCEQHDFEVFNVPLSLACYRSEEKQNDAMAGALADVVQKIRESGAQNPLILVDGLDCIEYSEQQSLNDFLYQGVKIDANEKSTVDYALEDYLSDGQQRNMPIIVVSRYDFTPQLHNNLRNTLMFYGSVINDSPVVRKRHVQRDDANRRVILDMAKNKNEEQWNSLSQKVQKNSV
jgi:hypothetical protein